MQPTPASYHAHGGEVALEPTSFVGVDLGTAETAAVGSPVLDAVRAGGRRLRRDIVLLDEGVIDTAASAALDGVGALHPVFRDPTGSLVVVLPEVRVEGASPEGRARIRHDVDGDEAVEVLRDDGDRLVLRPASGRGLDALALANRVHDLASPAMSQPRLLRVVERPDPPPST